MSQLSVNFVHWFLMFGVETMQMQCHSVGMNDGLQCLRMYNTLEGVWEECNTKNPKIDKIP